MRAIEDEGRLNYFMASVVNKKLLFLADLADLAGFADFFRRGLRGDYVNEVVFFMQILILKSFL